MEAQTKATQTQCSEETALPCLDARSLAKTVILTAAFVAAAVVGRVAFAAVPNVQPMTAFCILAGIICGRRSGLAVGVAATMISNIFLGQGVWTVWQMAGWGLSGYVSGLLFNRNHDAVAALAHPIRIYVYGCVASLVFGFLMDSQIVLMFGGAFSAEAIWGIYTAGLPMNIAHAVGTVAFLIPLCAGAKWWYHKRLHL